jgi:uncharacterized protein (DUF302 family)
MDYGHVRTVDLGLDEAVEKVTATLQQEGFGILCEIDVKATLKKKLDIDRSPYRILGACNPPLAHHALDAEPEVGLLMPCNVVVFQGEDGRTRVASVDVNKLLSIVGRPELKEIAVDVSERLRRAVEAV